MVRIEAFFRPARLDDVKFALNEIGVTSMSVIEIRGAGKQKGYTQHYRGSEYQVNLLPKIQLIVVVPDDRLDAVVGAIENAAKSATAKSSSCRCSRRCVSAQASAAMSRFRRRNSSKLCGRVSYS